MSHITRSPESPDGYDRDGYGRDGGDAYLQHISALLDGELEPSKLLEVVDRIADDHECRSFYRKSRALSGLVAAAEPAAQAAAPAHLWTAIARKSGIEAPTAAQPLRIRAWLRRHPISGWLRKFKRTTTGDYGPILATAVILLAVGGLTWIGFNEGLFDPQSSAPVGTGSETSSEGSDGFDDSEVAAVIEIGSNEKMDERRFIHLAAEILQSDRRYRQELLRLMTDIERSAGPPEGIAEGSDARRTESSRARESFERDAVEGDSGEARVRVPLW